MVKYLYIDDPISSLDDNNAIAVASDLVQLLKKGKDRLEVVVSSHHCLFHNVVWNEFRSSRVKYKSYFYHRSKTLEQYTLQATNETPFFHHVAMLSELKQAADSGRLYTHHFNMLRSILEKTATFFGFEDFSACIHGIDDEILYTRALNLLSHGKYSVYEPREMVADTKELFKEILTAFLDRYRFDLPELEEKPQTRNETMTEHDQRQLGIILWGIADQLRGAMNADDFRDYMLSFLFLRYLSDNYETAAQKELGSDYPQLDESDRRTPLSVWYAQNPDDTA